MAKTGGRVGAEQAVIERLIIAVGEPDIGDDGRVVVRVTMAAEIRGSTEGLRTSGTYPWPVTKTVQQRRAELRDIAQTDLPGYFEGGAVLAAGVTPEYFGI